MRKLKLLCFLVGGYKLAEVGVHSYQGLQTYCFPASLDLKTRYGASSYALISDSTSLLGQEFSKVLADSSQNLVLLSQNASELSRLQTELQTAHPSLDIRAITVGGSPQNKEYYEGIFKGLEGVDVGLLVNTYEQQTLAKSFEETSAEELRAGVLDKLVPGTVLTKEILTRFQKREANSGIITVGSMFGSLPSPYFALEAGNMGYMGHLTRSLGHEAGEKVDVLLVTPGPLKTQGFGEWEHAEADKEEVVRNSLRNLGGKRWIVGSWKQGVLFYLMERMPKFVEKMGVVRGLMNIQANK